MRVIKRLYKLLGGLDYTPFCYNLAHPSALSAKCETNLEPHRLAGCNGCHDCVDVVGDIHSLGPELFERGCWCLTEIGRLLRNSEHREGMQVTSDWVLKEDVTIPYFTEVTMVRSPHHESPSTSRTPCSNSYWQTHMTFTVLTPSYNTDVSGKPDAPVFRIEDAWMNMLRWWDDTDRRKSKYWGRGGGKFEAYEI